MLYANLEEAVEKLRVLKMLSEAMIKELDNKENNGSKSAEFQCYEEEFSRIYREIFGAEPKKNMVDQVRAVRFF